MPDFKPKVPVQLAPPKSDPISLDELAQADGKDGGKCYVAIKVRGRESLNTFVRQLF
ncbi:hypothetical protein SLS53_003380 [Cytospora paraplurivora]|uniref:Uncharacterized protein n=1 Tax=Cytospora paraplurivora TaxID=2898453 RepID=A0AAN9UCN5_9PEZI